MKKYLLFPFIVLVFSGCSVLQQGAQTQVLDEVELVGSKVSVRPYYQESPRRLNDLLHTKLEVSFDWEKRHLLGRAYLTLKPYFSAQNTVVLDAKGFDVHRVSMLHTDGSLHDLTYTYTGLQLVVELGRTYTREEDYTLFIDYTAKPDELEVEGSSAITDAKGLYFINPDGKENKPTQLWTQGEPESNSCWFPCIDKPNERCTQEIAIRVKDKFQTLSNGLKISSVHHDDGTRTDVWKQELEHAPYLFMMAVGEFHITEDRWRSVAVDYYVEHEEAQHAQRIFGKTPAMMEYYSTLLGFDYPWEKYAQVIVRDYVSGAMENTTAVIHGEFVYSDEREYIDDPNEMIIAHELFHHWFGDWVTCESWPNLPLNEAFATYGEYLWMEGAYSADAAAHYLHGDLKQYLSESRRKQVDLIRFDNADPGNMFDSHSYAKGGRILHMLRYTVGDDAFFKGLEHYLKTYANQAVEVHHLRLAMEFVSGMDLNWFFNQWFLASGHPLLEINEEIRAGEVVLTVSQTQSLETTPLYRLPVSIDVYIDGKVQRIDAELEKQVEEIIIPVSGEVDLVVFDPEHYLLAEVSYAKSDREWLHQLQHAAHYYDRMEALDSLAQSDIIANVSRGVKFGLQDSFWDVNVQALNYVEKVDAKTQGTLESGLSKMAQNHSKSDVRASAITVLSTLYDNNTLVNGKSHAALYAKMCNDSSYVVSGAALNALSELSLDAAYAIAKKQVTTAGKEQLQAVIRIIATRGNMEDAGYLMEFFEQANGFEVIDAGYNLLLFLQQQDIGYSSLHLDALFERCSTLERWYERYYMLNMVKRLLDTTEGAFRDAVFKRYNALVQNESDPKVKKYLGIE